MSQPGSWENGGDHVPARPKELTPDRSARHLFGSEMRRMRLAADMSLSSLAEVVMYSKSSLARFETAEVMIPPDLPAKLDAAFATDGIFEKLFKLARREIHPDQYRRRMDLESQAIDIREFAGVLVPGLLQTEDYARALTRADSTNPSEEQVEELVTARMARQALLLGAPKPTLHVVLSEAALRLRVGSATIMREQLQALVPLVDTRTTTVQALPCTAGEHGLLGGSAALWQLADGSSFAYEETIGSGTLLEETATVRARQRAYDRARSYALSPADTAEFMRTLMEEPPHEYRNHRPPVG